MDTAASPSQSQEFPTDSFLVSSPLSLIQDTPEAADLARKRLVKKSRLSRIFSFRDLHSSTRDSSFGQSDSSPEVHISDVDNTPIGLDNSALNGEDIFSNRYEWAIVYENQRGVTMFSVPYYSSLSLLPSDPSPFTFPQAPLKRSKQPPISLENYPLPDGNWRWVSRCWMIDMRTDTGEVQHDGFEYNWMFRKHNWRAQIGSFNAGGWVRRRRWIRLMVRPARPKIEITEVLTPSGVLSAKESENWPNNSMASSHPPSVNSRPFFDRTDSSDLNGVWLGDPDGDWQRCRALMKRLVRDGRKLELWRRWLGFSTEPEGLFVDSDEKGKTRTKQWSEDDEALPLELQPVDILLKESVSIAPREPLVSVLQTQGREMLHLFVFPESRVQFLQLLGKAGLWSQLNIGLGLGFGSTQVEFWSYTSGLGDSSTK